VEAARKPDTIIVVQSSLALLHAKSMICYVVGPYGPPLASVVCCSSGSGLAPSLTWGVLGVINTTASGAAAGGGAPWSCLSGTAACCLLLLPVQVLGAAADALGTAYAAVRPEVQSAALPVKVRWCGGDCVAAAGAVSCAAEQHERGRATTSCRHCDLVAHHGRSAGCQLLGSFLKDLAWWLAAA